MWTTGTALAATAALLTATTAASAVAPPVEPAASQVAFTDPVDDLWVIGPGEDDWDPFGRPRASVDVIAATARHRAHAVTATWTFRDLRRTQPEDFDLRIRAGTGVYRAIVSTTTTDRAGQHRLIDRSESPVTCPGLTHAVDYADDLVRVRVPRSCVGEPPWVRVALSVYLFRLWDTLSDNPHNDGPEATLTGRLPHE